MADSEIQAQIMAAFADPMNLPSTFWDYMIKRWQRDAPVFPISQVFGFTQFVPVTTAMVQPGSPETTTSTSYVDLATVGPTLSNMPDGKYVLFYGCAAKTTDAANPAHMCFSVNGAAVDANNDIFSGVTGFQSILSLAPIVTLSNGGNNSITAKYKSSNAAVTASFASRILVAFRYANL